MSKIIIEAITEKAKPVLKSQYKQMRYLKPLFILRKISIEYKNDILIFNSKTNSINESALPQMELPFSMAKLKKDIDYKIEVTK